MVSKESESYRLQMLRHLKQVDNGPPPSEVLEAEKIVANYREEQAQARSAIPRLGLPLPEPNICSPCWFLHGRRSVLVGIPHPINSDKYDRMRCRVCKEIEDREA